MSVLIQATSNVMPAAVDAGLGKQVDFIHARRDLRDIHPGQIGGRYLGGFRIGRNGILRVPNFLARKRFVADLHQLCDGGRLRLRQIRKLHVIPGIDRGGWIVHLHGVVRIGCAVLGEFLHHSHAARIAVGDRQRILVTRLDHAPDVLLNHGEVLTAKRAPWPPEVVGLVPELIERLALA